MATKTLTIGEHRLSKETEMSTPVKEADQSQTELQLYPNPANHSVTLFYGVPEDFSGKSAEIEIFDMLGQLVWRTDEPVSPGLNKTIWNGVGNEGHVLTNGKYVVRISLGRKIMEQDFTLILG